MPSPEPTIKLLPPHLTALIAAGEVVERPAAVVKELIENALDAGAKAINVAIEEGGLRLIRVGDDGRGMNRPDTSLALQAFATSKISQPADLSRIHTYGFRGEALSSIAAVAQVEILTRTAAEIEGTRLISPWPPTKPPQIQPAASPVGTQVTVQHLFAAVPARRKFLKAPLREQTLVQQVVERYALAQPQVAFRLLADGRPRLVLPPGTILERIGGVLGRDVAGEMASLGWEALDLRVGGYISKPSIGRSRRDGQYFTVNGRPVRSGLLAVMLERPYNGLLPPGRHPLAVVRIELDPGFVDVNVHPQKAEVRFSRERSVYGALSQAVTEALRDFPRQAFAGLDELAWPFAGFEGSPPELAGDALHDAGGDYVAGSLRPLAQIHHTYILAQAADGVLIIDQHAAHEQILFERLTAGGPRIEAIEPVQLALTSREADLLAANLPLFAGLGFELASFGRNHFLIRSLPAPLQPHLTNQVTTSSQPLAAVLLSTLLAELEADPSLAPDAQRDKLAQKAACVCALKAGDHLSLEEMQTLLDELSQTWSPAACPHGRPVLVSLSLSEIERRFGRR